MWIGVVVESGGCADCLLAGLWVVENSGFFAWSTTDVVGGLVVVRPPVGLVAFADGSGGVGFDAASATSSVEAADFGLRRSSTFSVTAFTNPQPHEDAFAFMSSTVEPEGAVVVGDVDDARWGCRGGSAVS